MLDSVGNVFSNPQQYTDSDTQFINDGHRKIAATTDKSIMVPVLANPNHTDPVMTFLPEPSSEFINHYINSDIKIKNVFFKINESNLFEIYIYILNLKMEKKYLQISLEDAKEIYGKGNDVMDKLILNTFNRKELGLPPTKWEDVDEEEIINMELTKQMQALRKLVRLRDIYNDGWIADWTSDEPKYVIYVSQNSLTPVCIKSVQSVMCFKTKELRDTFHYYFKYLLDIAKPLL